MEWNADTPCCHADIQPGRVSGKRAKNVRLDQGELRRLGCLKGLMSRIVITLLTLLLWELCVKKIDELFLCSKGNQHHRPKCPSAGRWATAKASFPTNSCKR
jgi:hypothetical protein